MAKPIETLTQFILGKVPLHREVYIVELGKFVSKEGGNPKYVDRLIQYSKQATIKSLDHFSKDNSDLADLSRAILSNEYGVSQSAKKNIIDRLDTIYCETVMFHDFIQKIRPLSNESEDLSQLMAASDLLITPIKNNIKAISKLI
ncbi:MAG: hypothetical protein V1678_04360 [Candidatus Aenigmatarchaeota archaeon]